MRDVEKPNYLADLASQAIPPGLGLQFLKSESSILIHLIPPQKPVIFTSSSIVAVFHHLPPVCFVDWHWNQRWADLAAKILPKQTEQTSCHHGLEQINVAKEWQHDFYHTIYTLSVPLKRDFPYASSCTNGTMWSCSLQKIRLSVLCVWPALQADRLHLGICAFRSFRCFSNYFVMNLWSEVKWSASSEDSMSLRSEVFICRANQESSKWMQMVSKIFKDYQMQSSWIILKQLEAWSKPDAIKTHWNGKTSGFGTCATQRARANLQQQKTRLRRKNRSCKCKLQNHQLDPIGTTSNGIRRSRLLQKQCRRKDRRNRKNGWIRKDQKGWPTFFSSGGGSCKAWSVQNATLQRRDLTSKDHRVKQ